jgi:hypothetical protein
MNWCNDISRTITYVKRALQMFSFVYIGTLPYKLTNKSNAIKPSPWEATSYSDTWEFLKMLWNL